MMGATATVDLLARGRIATVQAVNQTSTEQAAASATARLAPASHVAAAARGPTGRAAQATAPAHVWHAQPVPMASTSPAAQASILARALTAQRVGLARSRWAAAVSTWARASRAARGESPRSCA